MLDVVWDHCVRRQIRFKFLTNRENLLIRNSKYADRAGSGKFITVYPAGDELEETLRVLDAELRGRPGPYILSDLRWESGPLYLRYGGFTERYCLSEEGERVPAIADPTGSLVPDPRRPGLTIPDWAPIPAFLAPRLAARRQQAVRPADFPFRIERPLHYSNGGGVYLATDLRTGRRVVLREARPHAGLDAAGRDAIQRLRHEREILARLAGAGCVPEVYGSFTCWEHHFLAEEYVVGETLGRAATLRYPLIRADCTEEMVAGYTVWALDILARVAGGLDDLHARGVVFGDLHPNNVIVRPDGRIAFVDFELASDADDETPAALGAPGFVPLDGRRGKDIDRYALACLRISMFLFLTPLIPLDPAKAAELVRAIGARFPVSESYARDVGRELRLSDVEIAPAMPTLDWPALRASIRTAILASATPERTDRLFPGDINQFSHNGFGLAYGAAGVLYALAATGAGRVPEYERWLVDAAKNRHDHRIGLYDGLYGVAVTLAELDRRVDALAVLERAMATPLDGVPTGLFSGLAGIGLSLLHFADLTGDRSLAELALEAAQRLEPRNGQRIGLLHGASGHALVYLRLFGSTGDSRFIDLAETALRYDIDRCVVAEDGSLQVDQGWRALPYVETGSAGIGLAIGEFLRHSDHSEFATALARIRRAAAAEFVVGSGLFNGRAGLLMLLCQTPRRESGPHVRRFAWHAIRYAGGVAFPGDQLLRLSMDLASGSAGVLLALSAALDPDGGATLPLLTARERRPVPSP